MIFHHSILRRAASIVTVATLFAASLSAQNLQYEVREGDALLSISRHYGVPVSTLLEANPTVRTNGLKVGEALIIPQSGTPDELARRGFKTTHIAKKKETLWAISKAYGLTVEELVAANVALQQEGSKLRKGDELFIPYSQSDSLVYAPATYDGLSSVSLAVVLPLTEKSTAANRCIEFYRGLLMAAEQAKRAGLNVRIDAINEPSENTSFAATISQLKTLKPNIVIGPLRLNHFDAMGQATRSELRGVRWLLPFSSRFSELATTPNALMLNAPIAFKGKCAAKLLTEALPEARFVFVRTDHDNKEELTTAMRKELRTLNATMAEGTTASTLTAMRASLREGRTTVFIPQTTEAEGIKAVVQAMLQLRSTVPNANFVLAAPSEWHEAKGASTTALHSIDTYVYDDHFYNRNDATTKSLTDEYRAWFHTDPIETCPRMFLQGYDSGLQLLTGLSRYGERFATQHVNATHCQQDITYERISAGGGLANASCVLIHYRTSNVVELIQPNL